MLCIIWYDKDVRALLVQAEKVDVLPAVVSIVNFEFLTVHTVVNSNFVRSATQVWCPSNPSSSDGRDPVVNSNFVRSAIQVWCPSVPPSSGGRDPNRLAPWHQDLFKKSHESDGTQAEYAGEVWERNAKLEETTENRTEDSSYRNTGMLKNHDKYSRIGNVPT